MRRASVVGVLEKYINQITDAFDASSLLDPDVEKIESTVYTAPLIYKYYSVCRRRFFERPQVRFSQRDALNDPFEMSQRWNEVSADGLRKYVKSRLNESLPKIFENTELVVELAK